MKITTNFLSNMIRFHHIISCLVVLQYLIACNDDKTTPEFTSKSYSFDAVGVIHHIGSTPHSGHYTADAVRNKDLGLFDDSRLGEGEKKWVTFDDTVTTFTDKATVLEGGTSQRNTYMAMYVAE